MSGGRVMGRDWKVLVSRENDVITLVVDGERVGPPTVAVAATFLCHWIASSDDTPESVRAAARRFIETVNEGKVALPPIITVGDGGAKA